MTNSSLLGLGVACLLGMHAAGCKNDGGGGGGGGGGGLPADQLAAEMAGAFCHKLFTCCDATELAANSLTMADEATCVSMVGSSLGPDVADVQASVSAGRTIYHGDHARACVDALVALPCDQWGGDYTLLRLPDCFRITEGTIAPGAACEHTAECIDGHCDLVAGCVADDKLGAACDIGSCVEGLSCITGALGTTATCGTVQPDGASCNYGGECASHTCATNAAGARVCSPPTMCNGV